MYSIDKYITRDKFVSRYWMVSCNNLNAAPHILVFDMFWLFIQMKELQDFLFKNKTNPTSHIGNIYTTYKNEKKYIYVLKTHTSMGKWIKIYSENQVLSQNYNSSSLQTK